MIIYRGIVTEASHLGVYVKIPALGGGIYGPMEVVVPDPRNYPEYKTGDRVIVSQVGGIKEDLIITGHAKRYSTVTDGGPSIPTGPEGDVIRSIGGQWVADDGLTQAEEDINAAQSDINSAQSDIATAQGNIGSLQASVSTINGLITTLQNTKAPLSHTHAAADVTSGQLDIARLPTVTVAKGGTGATTAAAARTNLGAAPTSHRHPWSDLDDIPDLLMDKGDLSTDDLNTIVENGIYFQPSNSSATTALHYPATGLYAGVLTVKPRLSETGNDMVYQTYHTYPTASGNRMFWRSYHETLGWSVWQEALAQDDILLHARRRGGRTSSVSVPPGTYGRFNPGWDGFTYGSITSTAEGLVAPVTGLYNVSAQIRLSTTSSAEFQVRINTTNKGRRMIGSGRFYIAVADIIDVEAGEEVWIELYNNASSNVTVEGFAGFDTPTLTLALHRKV